MSAAEPRSSRAYERLLLRADRIAREQRHGVVRPTHLLLAVMSDLDTPWPDLIVERGGLAYGSALRRLGWRFYSQPHRQEEERIRLRSSMRLSLLIAVAVLVRLTIDIIRRMFAIELLPQATKRLPLSAESTEVLRLAKDFESTAGAAVPQATGSILLALASRPGPHVRVLPNATVLACDLRTKLGLATCRHRLILACDRPKLIARRIHMRIDREVASHGRLSHWGAAWALYGAGGGIFAFVALFASFVATGLLYLFLWPAVLLVAGTRALCGLIVGCDARSYHWLSIPGGEVAVTPESSPTAPRAVAAALLAPRLLAAVFCIAAMTVLIWRSADLGVAISPVVFRRPDVIVGGTAESLWLGPLSIFSGMLEQDGAAAGIGLLAGLGAGVMSIPTFRELELIRLHAGHEAGGGSRRSRMLTAPASLFTGAVSCVEAVLPFTGAPMYATAYLVPLIFSALVAIVLLQLAPY
jgi:hypothetical protein